MTGRDLLWHTESFTTSVIINQRGQNGDDQDVLIGKCHPNDGCSHKKLQRDLLEPPLNLPQKIESRFRGGTCIVNVIFVFFF